MENINLTPENEFSEKKSEQIKTNYKLSLIFKNIQTSTEYLEIYNKEKNQIMVIFLNPSEINSKNSDFSEIIHDKINQIQEIIIIFDFQRLSLELETDELFKIIKKFYESIDYEPNISLIIKNSYINPEKELKPILFPNRLKLNKLEIHDEIYSLSTRLGKLLPDIEVNELILKKFKFNSKNQLSNFLKFILRVGCKKLTLEDIFVELIIKQDDNDQEYKDLDIYFAYVDGVITIDNNYTAITSLTMRDCPLFAIIGNMFTYQEENEDFQIIKRDIDIDETSLLNPFIITRFKIINGKFEICFDLDSFKLKLEEKEEKIEYDYIDYLDYIFNILIGFKRDNQKIVDKKISEWEEDEDGLREINREFLYKLTFKNFDTTKLEYITGDDMTFIEEKNWVLNEEEKKKKARWEKLEEDLKKFGFEKKLPNVKELVFDNCSNFFIKWIINFIKGENPVKTSENNDFDLLKIKKCAKDYVNLEKILQMKIDKLILFDNPLIIGNSFPKDNKYPHLEVIEEFGSIANLTIKINTLDGYGKHYNLNTYKTYEILEELILNSKFNKNIIFELYSLSNFMTFLAYKEYSQKVNYYNNPNDDEEGKDEINKEKIIIGIDQNENKDIDGEYHLPKLMIFGSKRYRDEICYKSFNIKALEDSKITLKTLTIKKQTENFDNQNYLSVKYKKNINNKNYTDNNLLKKIDFGSDGFFIERDYKFFFILNKINTVEFRNVIFSNYKDNNLKDIEGETITNLISIYDFEIERIEKNGYNEIKLPNFRIDYKTLNGILYKNYLFEDIAVMFTYYMYKIDEPKSVKIPVNPDILEKKTTLMEYFQKFKDLFIDFAKKINKLTIIINNIKELKEFCCTLGVLKVLLTKNLSEETFINPLDRKEKKIYLPKKSELEYEIGAYFLKEKNTEEKNCYSEFNYYYSSLEEENLITDKKIHFEFEVENDKNIKKEKIKYDIYIEYDFDIFGEIA